MSALIKFLNTEINSSQSPRDVENFSFTEDGLEKLLKLFVDEKNIAIRAQFIDLLTQSINDSRLLNNIGNKFFSNGQARAAVEFYGSAFRKNPDDPNPLRRKGNALRVIGEISQAVECYRQALAVKYNSELHSRLLLAMHYEDIWSPEELAKEHFAWYFNNNLSNSKTRKYTHDISDKKILKIAYISPDFRSHPVAYFFQPILRYHDRKNFHITCYSSQAGEDGVTRWIKGACDKWREVHSVPTEKLAKIIQEDNIDILIDLAGHTSGNRLDIFQLRSAPVQITYLGYPNGTGIPDMDYRITDAESDPIGTTEHLYKERLIRVRPCFLTFEPPSMTPDVAPSPFMNNKFITFGSFNKFSKVSSACIEAWVAILNKVPHSRLFLKTGGLDDSEEKIRAIDRFTKAGLLDASRVEIHDLVPSRNDHLRLYERIDIALDPFPYNGTTTTCQALWMGVPVISLSGDRHVSRVGASILGQMGLKKLVAESVEGYIKIAIDLAHNCDEVISLRSNIRSLMRNSPLLDHMHFVANLEQMLRSAWQNKIEAQKAK